MEMSCVVLCVVKCGTHGSLMAAHFGRQPLAGRASQPTLEGRGFAIEAILAIFVISSSKVTYL